MRLVADTSVVLAVALGEPERSRIVALSEGYDFLAPDVLPVEIANALTRLRRRNRLSASQVLAAWDASARIAVQLSKVDMRSVLEMATRHSMYAYDAAFLLCAAQVRAPMLTLDRRLKQIAALERVALLEI